MSVCANARSPYSSVLSVRVYSGASRGLQLRERDAEGLHLRGAGDHVVLLQLAAHRVDLDDARHRADLGHHFPVEHGAQLHRRVVARLAAHHEDVDLTEARRHRRQLRRRHEAGQVGGHFTQALADELTREPHVHRVVEDDRHR